MEKKLMLNVERVYFDEKDTTQGYYYRYFLEFEGERIYFKPKEYAFSKYATTNLLKDVK